MSQSGTSKVSASNLPSNVPLIFSGNTSSGSAVNNIFQIIGIGGVSTNVSGNILTITSTGGGGTGILEITGNSGGPVMADGSNNLNLIGSGLITITGTAVSHTLTVTASATIPTTFTGNSGT